jgi:hypothetical protein
MRFKGHVVKLHLVFFLSHVVTLASTFQCTYKCLLEVRFQQTGTTKPADLPVASKHQLLYKFEGWEISSCLLHESIGIIRQGAKMAGRAGIQYRKDQNLSNGNDYIVGKSYRLLDHHLTSHLSV